MHAPAQCQAIGDSLATVQTQGEADNFRTVRKSPSSGYYIGPTDEAVERQFKWINGANWTETTLFWGNRVSLTTLWIHKTALNLLA